MTSMGSQARVVVLLGLTFVAGVAAGVAADRLGVLPGPASAEMADREADPDRDRERDSRESRTTIERFADDLGLTADQRSEIDRILERYRASAQSMWDEFRPRYRSMVDSVRTQIEGVLTSEQVTQYRELLRSRRDDRRRDDDGDDRRHDRVPDEDARRDDHETNEDGEGQ